MKTSMWLVLSSVVALIYGMLLHFASPAVLLGSVVITLVVMAVALLKSKYTLVRESAAIPLMILLTIAGCTIQWQAVSWQFLVMLAFVSCLITLGFSLRRSSLGWDRFAGYTCLAAATFFIGWPITVVAFSHTH